MGGRDRGLRMTERSLPVPRPLPSWAPRGPELFLGAVVNGSIGSLGYILLWNGLGRPGAWAAVPVALSGATGSTADAGSPAARVILGVGFILLALILMGRQIAR